MDAVVAPGGKALGPGYTSLSALSPGAQGVVVSVGSRSEHLTPLDRRLLEFGFCSGESIEVLAETRPGRDPFVVRVGNTTLALRRREAENIWVEITPPVLGSRPPCPPSKAPKGIEITPPALGSRPLPSARRPHPPSKAPEGVEISRPGKVL